MKKTTRDRSLTLLCLWIGLTATRAERAPVIVAPQTAAVQSINDHCNWSRDILPFTDISEALQKLAVGQEIDDFEATAFAVDRLTLRPEVMATARAVIYQNSPDAEAAMAMFAEYSRARHATAGHRKAK